MSVDVENKAISAARLAHGADVACTWLLGDSQEYRMHLLFMKTFVFLFSIVYEVRSTQLEARSDFCIVYAEACQRTRKNVPSLSKRRPDSP